MKWLEQRKRERDDELLSAYVDGQLLGRARQEFEARLAVEPELRARLEATRRMMGLVRSLPPVPAPRNFILDPARVGKPARARQAARWYPTLRLATTLATALLIVVFAGDLIFSQALRMPTAIPAVAPFRSAEDGGAELTLPAQPTAAPLIATAAPPPEDQSAPGPTMEAAAPQLAAAPTAQGDAAQQPPAMEKSTAEVEGATPVPSGPMAPAASAVGGGRGADTQATPSMVGPGNPTPAPTPTVEPSPIPPAPTATPPVEVGQAPPEAPPGAPYAAPISTLRIVEIGLAGLVVLLGLATILARRSA